MPGNLSSQILRFGRRGVIAAAKTGGAFSILRNSDWRRSKLLILCYHGIALADENAWDPTLFLTPQFFRRRLELIRHAGYKVVSLDAGLNMLQAGTLDEPAVAITFDDGTFDFHQLAWPILREFHYPATVYVTTYYSLYNKPIFDPALAYLLWKSGGTLQLNAITGESISLNLADPAQRGEAARRIRAYCTTSAKSGAQKDDLLQHLANLGGISYQEMVDRRILHIMTPGEISDVASQGADVQLHTHRHRTPSDQPAFNREVSENREILESLTGKAASSFCYPSGVHSQQMAGWLKQMDVRSAVTCNSDLVDKQHDMLLLPRFVDTASISETEFQSFLCGFGFPLIYQRTHGEII